MRALLGLLAVLVLLALPLAGAEQVRVRAAGGTVSPQGGVTGLQWDHDSGVGVRYWRNGTQEEQVVLVATACVGFDNGLLSHCERPRLTA